MSCITNKVSHAIALSRLLIKNDDKTMQVTIEKLNCIWKKKEERGKRRRKKTFPNFPLIF